MTLIRHCHPGSTATAGSFGRIAAEATGCISATTTLRPCASIASWKGCQQTIGTVAELINHFTSVVCPAKVKAGKLKPRTARDYLRDSEVVKAALGHIPYTALKPHHVKKFADTRSLAARSHARNEVAALSAAIQWAVEDGKLHENVCRAVEWPTAPRRMRLVSDAEFLKVYNRASDSVKLAMLLGIRTLASPGDILDFGPGNIVPKDDGSRVFRFARGKTGVVVEVHIVGELQRLIDEQLAKKVVYPTFVHREDGKSYTVEGIGSMFRRYCMGSKGHPLPEDEMVRDFGIRDLRAKGATEEYRNGRPLRELQVLLGHRSLRTTEVYIKELVPEAVRPNERPILASAS